MPSLQNETIQDRSAAAQNGTVPAVAPVTHNDGREKPFKSKGYHVHNEFTYRGIDWLANSAVGVTSTYVAARTEIGRKVFKKPVTDGIKKVLSWVTKDADTLTKGSSWGASFLSIMIGGFAIIPVMMFMEKKEHKKSIIRWLDEKIYGKESVANDPRFQQSYDKIDQEPSKGFWTGFAARLIAVAPLFAMAVTPKINNKLIDHVYDPIGRVTQRVFQKLHLNLKTPPVLLDGKVPLPEGQLMSKRGHLADTDTLSNNDYLHRNIGFDFGLTIFYAILHEMAYKALASRSQNKKKSKTDAPAAPALQADSLAEQPAVSPKWAEKYPRNKPVFEKPTDYAAVVDQSRASLPQQLAH